MKRLGLEQNANGLFRKMVPYCLVDKSSLKCIMESDNVNELVEDAIIDTM